MITVNAENCDALRIEPTFCSSVTSVIAEIVESGIAQYDDDIIGAYIKPMNGIYNTAHIAVNVSCKIDHLHSSLPLFVYYYFPLFVRLSQ